MARVVKHLPSVFEALGSIPSTEKEKKKSSRETLPQPHTG
jgi:hypothetical protein